MTINAAKVLADAGQPIPFIDRIVEFVVQDPSTQWLMFVRGQLESSGISRDNWNAVLTMDRRLTPELREQSVSVLRKVFDQEQRWIKVHRNERKHDNWRNSSGRWW